MAALAHVPSPRRESRAVPEGAASLGACAHRLFEAFPPLKYLLYTPSYHSLHHSRVHTNFCLFMPFYDYVYGTASPESDSLHASAWQGGRVASDQKPDVVSPLGTRVSSSSPPV
jgi:sterol desaturase/sphingolipid hydroxylase (fatty acid hydroxylase superfamily)